MSWAAWMIRKNLASDLFPLRMFFHKKLLSKACEVVTMRLISKSTQRWTVIVKTSRPGLILLSQCGQSNSLVNSATFLTRHSQLEAHLQKQDEDLHKEVNDRIDGCSAKCWDVSVRPCISVGFQAASTV